MAHERLINSNRTEIATKLDLRNTTLLDALLEKKVISATQQRNIKLKGEGVGQASFLLDELARGSPNQFSLFLKTLRENDHCYLAEIIESRLDNDQYRLEKPRIVPVARSDDPNDPGINATLEVMRKSLLYIDGDVVDHIMNESDMESLDLNTVTLLINSIPEPVVLPRGKPKKVSVLYVVSDTVQGCTINRVSNDQMETITAYTSGCISPPNKIFFLGNAVQRDWEMHLEHDTESFNYIPAPMSFKNARLASTEQDRYKMQVLFDVTGVQFGPRYENVVTTLEKAVKDVKQLLPVVALTSCDTDMEVKNRLRQFVRVLQISSKQEIISKFRGNTIWVYIEDNGPLSWTRMQPVLYGMPQVLPKQSVVLDILNDDELREKMTWDKESPVKEKVKDMLEHLGETYERAHNLTCKFLCSPLVMKSREDFFKTCFSSNLAVLKAGIFKKTAELGDEAPSVSSHLYSVIARGLNSLLGLHLGVNTGGNQKEKGINIKILKYLSEQLPDNTKLIACNHGSIAQLLYVRDEEALFQLRNVVREGKTSRAMLQILLLLWTQVFAGWPLKKYGVQMELHSPNTYEVIARDRALMEDVEMSQILRMAAMEGNVDLVKLLLDNDVIPDQPGEDGRTALHFASKNGHADVCMLLLDRKADVNLKDKDGRTPSHFASENGHADICALLLERGAQINIQDRINRTPLQISAKHGHAHVEKLLLEGEKEEGPLQVKDKINRTPLKDSAEQSLACGKKPFPEKESFLQANDKDQRKLELDTLKSLKSKRTVPRRHSWGSPSPGIKSLHEKARYDTSLGLLTKKFVGLLKSSPDGVVNLNKAAELLDVQKRRISDITEVLAGINLVSKKSKNDIQWKGSTASTAASKDSTSLSAQHTDLQVDLADLNFKENRLDELIRNCTTSLRHLTQENARLAYVTRQDLREKTSFGKQTLMVVKAPSETKLEIPDPSENKQIWMKSSEGPIDVHLCTDDVGTTSTVSTPLPIHDESFSSSTTSTPLPKHKSSSNFTVLFTREIEGWDTIMDI